MLEWQLKNLEIYADKIINNIELTKLEREEWEELNELFSDENSYNCWKGENLNNI